MTQRKPYDNKVKNSHAATEEGAPEMTADEADRLLRSYKEKPVGMLSEEEKRQRIHDLKRACAFNRKQISEQMPPTPPAVVQLDHAALSWIAGRCVDTMFRLRLEEVVINLVKEGCLFESPYMLLWASIERLRAAAAVRAQPVPSYLSGLTPLFDAGQKAQAELANLTSLFIQARHITAKGTKSIMTPWLQAEARREYFKTTWQTKRGKKKPHNRVQFEFIFTCVAEFDAMLKELFDGPLRRQEDAFPPPRSDAAAFVANVEAKSEPMAASLKLILDETEQMQANSFYALGTPWACGWDDMRLNRKERVIEMLEPFIKSRWVDFKKQNPRRVELKAIKSDIAKRPWRIAWQSLSKCLRTILDEWPYPPLDPDAAPRLIAKHTQRL